MSFVIDPPLLFLSGLIIFFLGQRLEWNRHAKIVVGIAIVLTFIIFSALLYLDIFRCVFPFFAGMSGSEFMLHTNITGISKADVPSIIVVILFILYPFWIFFGYASTLLVSKRRRVSKEQFSYSDVKSKSRSLTRPPVFAVARDPDAKKCVRSALDAIGGMERYVKKGDKVLIKVNICGGVPEIRGTFTSTEVVGVLVDQLKALGAEIMIADADMVWTKFWQAASDSGWTKWARENNVKLQNLSESRIAWFDFGEDSAIGRERISKDAIEADVIISVPVMKTHLLTGVTIGMKNMYGTIPEIDKAKFHRKKIENVIYEINLAFTPTLTIIDGTIGGEAIGPLSCAPLNYQTVIASNNVVTADAVACQLMGYDPMEITHIKNAHERGLGDASVKFDLKTLPYKNPSDKDGNWNRPQKEVKDFYEWGIELLLTIPGWETLFNIGADFILYDLARLPFFRYLTPAFLQLLNDAVYLNIKDFRDTEEDRARRKTNLIIVALLSLACIAGFIKDGYIWRSNLAFDFSFLAAIIIAVIASLRMKTRDLCGLLLSSALVSAVVEHTNTSAGLLTYTGSAGLSIYIITGWMIFMAVILQFTDLLAKWLKPLGIFARLQSWNNLPFALSVILFATFMTWEGYWAIAGRNVVIMYTLMAALGLFYSRKHSIEWNSSLLVTSIVVGGAMELLGSLAGFWVYHFHEPLSISIVLSWAMNAWAVHGLTYLMGIDLGSYKDRYLYRSARDGAEGGDVPWFGKGHSHH